MIAVIKLLTQVVKLIILLVNRMDKTEKSELEKHTKNMEKLNEALAHDTNGTINDVIDDLLPPEKNKVRDPRGLR